MLQPVDVAERKSYSSGHLGVRARLVELGSLALASRDAGAAVEPRLAALAALRARAEEATGVRWSGATVLEIGSGPLSIEAIRLALDNRVVGIDRNIVPVGLDVATWVTQLRTNGPLRTVKTLGRRALGQDRRVRRAILDELDIAQLPTFELESMDAAELSFADGTFDVVTSRSVYEHLVDPAAVTREAVRVLRPGGVFAISLHLYTSDSGCHDPRIFRGRRSQVPPWAHLRPAHEAVVIENAYLNRLRLDDWRALFAEELPGSSVVATMDGADAPGAGRRALAALRDAGELAELTDEELLSESVHVIWQKPTG